MAYDRSREDIEQLAEESSDEYQPFDFVDPNQMMLTFSPALARGDIEMHEWQKEVNLFISGNHGQLTPDRNNPLRFHLVAANGSGKDSMVIAAFAVWMAMTKVRARIIITSKSVTQLRGQTEPNIRMLCDQVNKRMPQKIFLTHKGHYFCFNTGAEIILFCTDEEERAEGFHPHNDAPFAPLAIITNEAKSIGDPIFDALKRCTFTHWIEVSSSGKRQGHFYRTFQKSHRWDKLYKWDRKTVVSRTVTSYDCPHKSLESIQADAEDFGETSALFRSKHLSQFCSESDSYVLSEAEILLSLRNTDMKKMDCGLGLHAGCDAAQGGDMNALYLFDENVFVDRLRFSIEDATEAARGIVDWLDSWWEKGLKAESVIVDDGVASKPIFDIIRNYEYPDPDNPGKLHKRWANIVGCRNQSVPMGDKKIFGNRGAQNYFKFKKICHLIRWHKSWTKQSIPIRQLLSRQFVQKGANEKIFLQPKREIPKGESPDDADAIVLAFSHADIEKILKSSPIKQPIVKKQAYNTIPMDAQLIVKGQPPQSLATAMDNITYGEYDSHLQAELNEERSLIPSFFTNN